MVGKKNLPRLCAITDRRMAGGRSHGEITAMLIAGGARWIQVRDKAAPGGELLVQARESVRTARGHGVIVVVNDRIDVAVLAEADGVHVGREDLPAAEVRRLLGENAVVGVSTHSVEEGIAAAKLPVDYVAIGPVFATPSKEDAEPVVGIDAVRRLSEAIELPVVAIGGIDAERAAEVIRAGAHAVAVISALYRGGRPIAENVAALLRTLES